MKVLYSHHFSGVFANPAIILVDTGVYFNKIHSGQADFLTFVVNGPVNVNSRPVGCVLVVIRITVPEFIKHIVRSSTAFVYSVLWQPDSFECQFVGLHPHRKVRLCVECILREIS